MQAAESDNDRVPPNAGSRLASGQLDRKQWLIAQAVPGEESVDLVPPCECVAVASSRMATRHAARRVRSRIKSIAAVAPQM